MPIGTLRSNFKKITCNFSNAKILPTSFWTQWTRAWLSRLPLGIALAWSLSLSCLLLSPTSCLAPASLCLFSSSSAHSTVSALPPCTLSCFTSRLFPLDQSGSSSSLCPRCQNSGCLRNVLSISCALSMCQTLFLSTWNTPVNKISKGPSLVGLTF